MFNKKETHNKSNFSRSVTVVLILILFSSTLSSCHFRREWIPNFLLFATLTKEDFKEFITKRNESSQDEYLQGKIEEMELGDVEEDTSVESDPPGIDLPPGNEASSSDDLPLKPVGFVNYGTINATVRPYTYIPLGAAEPRVTPPSASTVSSAHGTGGDWPNTSRFISVPMGTYTWCIDWEEEDQDGDGYFDYYHYYETEPTLLDHNDSDDLDLAEEVAISAPPDTAPIYEGKCGESEVVASCYGKDTFVQTLVRNVNQEPIYPLDLQAIADTNFRVPPDGIQITFSATSGEWYGSKILWGPGDWIEATTSDPYSAMGVQIFGDQTIGWARVLFDGSQIWEGDTSECVIDPNENSGLGWYGIYVEVLCFPPGTHTLRVETGQAKEGVGGWQGGVPVGLFGFRW